MPEKTTVESVSESGNPSIPAPALEAIRPRTNRGWWPNQPDLQVLHQQSPRADPRGDSFDYAKEFEGLDIHALKRDIVEVMTTSQAWWPANYGHYGPLFIRIAWSPVRARPSPTSLTPPGPSPPAWEARQPPAAERDEFPCHFWSTA